MSATTIRCLRCNAILGNGTGPFLLSAWAHRSYVVWGVSFLVCDQCGGEWSPHPVNARERRSVECILAESQAVTLRCLTDGCGRILGQIGKVGQPVAVVRGAKRVIACEAIVFAACPDCRVGWEPPFHLHHPSIIAADEAAKTRPVGGASSISDFL